MLKLTLKVYLIVGLVNGSLGPSSTSFRNYSSQLTNKTLNNLKPIKVYNSLHQPSKQKQMLSDLTNQGGIMLFLAKNSSLYAIEGSNNLANYLTMLFKKDYLKNLVSLKSPIKRPMKIKSLYQDLNQEGWKDYDLYLLEVWDTKKTSTAEERLAYYHTKYLPKLNLFRYVSTNGKIEVVYQWNNFKTKEQLLTVSQKKATLKPLLTYRIDDKIKGKVYYENKHKSGIYRVVNRDTKQSYISSSLNLGQILYALDSNSLADDQQVLYSAMQEHSTSFNLQILAYCSEEELAGKEAYYIQIYQPEYNTPKKSEEDQLTIESYQLPTSLVEYNALAKQLILFQPPNQQLTSINFLPKLSLTLWEVKPVHLLIREDLIPVRSNAKTKKTWTLSEATRLKQSLAQQKRTKQPREGFKVQVQDLVADKATVYSSYREAARALNISVEIISKYLSRNQSKAYKKRYIFTKI